MEPPRYPDTGGLPRWVKVSAIIAIILGLLVVITMLIGGGGHGPGRHTSSVGLGGQTASSSVVEDHALPEGGHG